MKIVVDVNVVLSGLLKDAFSRRIILQSGHDFYFPGISLQKIQKYEPYLLEKSGLSRKDFQALLGALYDKIRVVPIEDLQGHWETAKKIMGPIDPEDAVFIAAALSLGAVIWSDDAHFDRQKKVKVFKTPDMAKG